MRTWRPEGQLARTATLALLLAAGAVSGQAPPEDADVEASFVCPGPDEPLPPPASDEQARERQQRERYRQVFPLYVAAAGLEVNERLPLPVEGLRIAQVADSWGRPRGGLTVTIVGGAGRRYYYAHLSAYAAIYESQRVTPETVIGFVGTSGNAGTTPPHLHFGVYESQDPEDPCGWDAIDPLPLLVNRD